VSADRRHQRKPIFDVNRVTSATIEICFADRRLESFGKNGAGGFWWHGNAVSRRIVQRLVRFIRAIPPTELSGTVRPRPRKLLAFPLAFFKVAQR
jgi:hypothetical protein